MKKKIRLIAKKTTKIRPKKIRKKREWKPNLKEMRKERRKFKRS